MTTTISHHKAIQTHYGNRWFRSRVEARYAVAFDEAGIAYDHEPEGYVLPSGPYLPDFWLPRLAVFAEVKGGAFLEVERRKCAELAESTGFPCLLLDGPPRVGAFEYFYIFEGSAHLGDYELELTEAAVRAALSERFGR